MPLSGIMNGCPQFDSALAKTEFLYLLTREKEFAVVLIVCLFCFFPAILCSTSGCQCYLVYYLVLRGWGPLLAN